MASTYLRKGKKKTKKTLHIPENGSWAIDPNPVCDIAFFDESGEVGRLTFSNGQIHFTGNADESAKQFFDFLKESIDNYIKEERE